ncbi:MAG: hypothetical protein KAH09_02000 [Desulfobacula sp.]|nr:hypothetical protein [Desulfobacula sp.]
MVTIGDSPRARKIDAWIISWLAAAYRPMSSMAFSICAIAWGSRFSPQRVYGFFLPKECILVLKGLVYSRPGVSFIVIAELYPSGLRQLG